MGERVGANAVKVNSQFENSGIDPFTARPSPSWRPRKTPAEALTAARAALVSQASRAESIFCRPPVQEQLNLTGEQQNQLATLETEMQTKLGKIFSAEQLRQAECKRAPGDPGAYLGRTSSTGRRERRAVVRRPFLSVRK